jgi:hypothetical protein
MTNNGDDEPGQWSPAPEEPGARGTPAKSPPDKGVEEPSSKDRPSVAFEPLPSSRSDSAREKRALRRAYHARTMPSWVGKIPWFIFPLNGYMRMHDPNYEEHFQQWTEGQRRTYLERGEHEQ